MTGDQLIERLLQRRDIQRAFEAQGGRQVVRGAMRVQLPEEPLALLRVGQGQRLSAFDGHQWQLMLPCATVQAGDEIPEHAAFEQAAQGDIQPQGLTHPGDDLRRQQRMAAECEEVIREAHLLKVEHALPDFGDLGFQGRSRRHIVVLLLAGIRLGQRFTVQFAVGAQGQYIKEHQEARHHVVRQHGCQRGLDRLTQLCVGHGRGMGHHITHQLQTAGCRLGEDDGVSHHVLLQQSGLDFAQLDTETANLHLMVDPADIFDHPVGGVARKVAGAVQAAADLAERVGHEALGRQVRAIEITACQQLAADHQFAHHANRRRGTAVVQQVNAAPGQNLADGHGQWRRAGAGYVVGAIEGRDGHRGFSRAIGVEQFDVAKAGLAPRGEAFRRHGFTTGMHLLESPVIPWTRRGKILGQQVPVGRGQVDHTDLVFEQCAIERLGVPDFSAAQHHRRAADQCRIQLLDETVEVEGGKLQDAVATIEIEKPQRHIGMASQRGLVDAHAFWPARGTGGEHHIRKVIGMGTIDQVAIVQIDPGLVLVQAQVRHIGRNLQAFAQVALGQHQLRAAVFDHAQQPILRVFRVQGHVGAAGLEHRQQADDHVQAALHGNPHQHVGPDAQTHQMAGQAVGLGVEFGVTQLAVFEEQCRG
ncbi:hypothetical protein PS687_05970 [Pseudomonas fluorescens]|nr:hypothetical protein PS687_05970 [Pseudomonas fluorescens]